MLKKIVLRGKQSNFTIMAASRCSAGFLVVNGVPVTGDVPPISNFLATSDGGAYTTTRTHGGASLLFWDRHLRRLADSARVLAEIRPDLLGSSRARSRDLEIHDSLRVGLALAMRNREVTGSTEELSITALLRGGGDRNAGLDVYLHIGFYAPSSFGSVGAHLALAGPGRDVAAAKYSEWARIRKGMEKMRPPLATELLLSNDGDRILEGSVTNFFVVCHRESSHDPERAHTYEVQTAPLSDGVLPGIIRQLVIEICSSMGIPLREVAPSWSDHEFWEEAFVTSSLRLVQHVETIQVPISCKEEQYTKSWNEVSWLMKRFEGVGSITTKIQGGLVERAEACGYKICNIL